MPPGTSPITLHYNSRIDRSRSRVTLSGPGSAKPAVLAIGKAGAQDVVQTGVNGARPGDYVLHWQVLATDGHITRGDVPFTVK